MDNYKNKNVTDFLEICILNDMSAYLAVGSKETNFHVSSRFSIHPLDALILLYLYKCDGVDFCLFWLCFFLYVPNSILFSRASAQVFLFFLRHFCCFLQFLATIPCLQYFLPQSLAAFSLHWISGVFDSKYFRWTFPLKSLASWVHLVLQTLPTGPLNLPIPLCVILCDPVLEVVQLSDEFRLTDKNTFKPKM